MEIYCRNFEKIKMHSRMVKMTTFPEFQHLQLFFYFLSSCVLIPSFFSEKLCAMRICIRNVTDINEKGVSTIADLRWYTYIIHIHIHVYVCRSTVLHGQFVTFDILIWYFIHIHQLKRMTWFHIGSYVSSLIKPSAGIDMALSAIYCEYIPERTSFMAFIGSHATSWDRLG